MLIMMSAQATPAEVANVMSHVRDRGYKPIELPGADRLAIGVLGSNPSAIRDAVVALPGRGRRDPGQQAVQDGRAGMAPGALGGARRRRAHRRRLAGRRRRSLRGGERGAAGRHRHQRRRGGRRRCCAAARTSRAARRTRFAGLGATGLEHLRRARELTGLPVVTEVLTPADVDSRRRGRRHAPGGHAQRAELQPARGGGRGRASRCSSSAG